MLVPGPGSQALSAQVHKGVVYCGSFTGGRLQGGTVYRGSFTLYKGLFTGGNLQESFTGGHLQWVN